MNVSLEHKIVWLATERCATKITKKIFEDYNFYSLDKKDGKKLKNFVKFEHSHNNYIPDEYKSYDFILSLRNPYDFVFSIYLKKYLDEPLTKKSTQVKEKFNIWVKKSFLNHGYEVFLNNIYNNPNSFFYRLKSNNEVLPKYVIKMENLEEDILNLPFISKEPEHTKEKIKKTISENGFINKRYFSFDELYETTSAKLVYHFFKSEFYKFNYCPYSFTKIPLSNEEKISFIHGELD